MTPSSTTPRGRRPAEWAVAVALGAVLLGSAAAHLGNPYYYLSAIYSYGIVGRQFGLFAAATLPAVQVSVGVCLLLGWWTRGAYLAAVVLFTGYAAAQWSALARGLDISCGCFGAGDGLTIGPWSLGVAGGCAVGSLAGLIRSRRPVVPWGEEHETLRPSAGLHADRAAGGR